MKKTIALLIAAVMVLTCATLLAACNNNDLESAALTEGVTLGPAVEGQDLDLNGKTITVTYKNGETKDVPLTAEMIAGFDKNTLGEQELTITYSEDGKSVSFTTKVTVIKAAPTSLELTASPEVTDYAAGEKFRPDGMVLTARFADGTSTTDIMPEYPDEALSADTDAVTVTYGALSVEVPVTVTASIEDDLVERYGFGLSSESKDIALSTQPEYVTSLEGLSWARTEPRYTALSSSIRTASSSGGLP